MHDWARLDAQDSGKPYSAPGAVEGRSLFEQEVDAVTAGGKRRRNQNPTYRH